VSQADIRLVTGHMRYGMHRALRRPCRYFTMLRDPVDRTISEYFYAYVYPSHSFREEIVIGSMSFADFLSAQGVSPAGAMTYLLSGEFEGLHDRLEAALFNLKNCFVSVGTSERFDESILLIARYLNWRPPLYVRRNVARLDDDVRGRRRHVVEEARESLSDYFISDYEVYVAADELLSDRVRDLGERFQKALEDYRELQEALARLDTGNISDTYTLDEDAPLPTAAADLLESTPYRALAEYLNEAPAKDIDRSSFVGFLEARSPTRVAGWAMDLARSEPIHVTVYQSGYPIGRATCDRQRPDVAAAGYPTDICGFNLQLDYAAGDLEQLTVCFADAPVQLTATGAARKGRN
jgi:hypothetical protein